MSSRPNLAPQRLRERTTAMRHSFAREWRGKSPAAIQRELHAAMRLLLAAQDLADKHYPSTRYHLSEAHRIADYAKDKIIDRRSDASAAPGYIVKAVERIPLKPAFKVGDDTPRGRVSGIGEYSPSNGWLYRVTNERGVRDQVWESTLVWPALHGRGGPLRGAARRRAYGVRDRAKRRRDPADEPHAHPGAYLPLNIGERRRFEAHGKPFIVGWHSRGNFWLATDPPGERRRWGNRDEIMKDMRYVFENGALPPASGPRW